MLIYTGCALFLSATLLVAGLEKVMTRRATTRHWRVVAYGEVGLAVLVASGVVPVLAAGLLLALCAAFLAIHVRAAWRHVGCGCFAKQVDPAPALAAAALRWLVALAALLMAPHVWLLAPWARIILGLPIGGGLVVFIGRFWRLWAFYRHYGRLWEGMHGH